MLLKDLPPAATVIGDQGYDRDKIRKMLAEQGILSCIPPHRCKQPVHDNKMLQQMGHKSDWRRIATRYDRCACTFRSAILLAAIVLFW